jgi:hypothetical protein
LRRGRSQGREDTHRDEILAHISAPESMGEESLGKSFTSELSSEWSVSTSVSAMLLKSFVIVTIDHVNTSKERSWVTLQYLSGPIPIMHINIHDSDSAEAPSDSSIEQCNGCIIKETKPCAIALLGVSSSSHMMPWRPASE